MRFRSGRWFLLAEGLLVSELACFAVTAEAIHPGYRAVGDVLFGLVLTPVRSGQLFGCGVVAILATLNRRAALVVTATATLALLASTTFGDLAAADGVPHKWGIDPHNAGLYAVLLMYNFILLVWMFPDTMAHSGPDNATLFGPRRQPRASPGPARGVIPPSKPVGRGQRAIKAPDDLGADVNYSARHPDLRKPQQEQ